MLLGSQEIFALVLGIALTFIVLIATRANRKKFKVLTIFQIASYFYLFIYAFVPAYYIFNIEVAPSKIATAYHTDYFYRVLLFAVVGYLFLIIAYGFSNRHLVKHKEVQERILPMKKYERWAIITFSLGLIGILVEIYLQGGIANSISNIELIRSFAVESSVKSGTNNLLVLFRNFKQFMTFSFYVYFMLARMKRLPKYTIMTIIAFIFTTYIVFIGGGRTHIIIFIVTVITGFIFNPQKETYLKNTKSASILIITGVIGVVSLIIFDPIFSYLTYGNTIEIDFSSNNIDSLVLQFSFPYYNMIFAISHDFQFRFFQDLFNWMINLLPSYFTSRIGLVDPVLLYEYNTVLQNGSMNKGGIPSDILTFGYYQMGLTGLLIVILIFGVLISKLDNSLAFFRDSLVLKPILIRVVIYIGMVVMYADLEGIFRNRFDVVLLICLLYDLGKYKVSVKDSSQNIEGTKERSFKKEV